MSKPIPIYTAPEEAYRADTCEPLVRAAERQEVRLHALVHGHYPGTHLPGSVLPGLKTVGYWDAAEDQSWGLPWHRNEGIEFTFPETGGVAFSVDDHDFDLKPDDLTITRPWQRHRVGRPTVTAGRLHWIIVDVGVRRPNEPWTWPPWVMLSRPDREELTAFLRNNEQPVWKATPEVRRCFQAIGQAVLADHGGSSVSRLTVRINDLLICLLDMLRNKDVRFDGSLSSTRRTVQLYLKDLRTHPEHLAIDWSVEDMAKACGLGVTQFMSHVKTLTNMSPGHFLNHCRLELGAGLLREHTDIPITEVALKCGFASSQYFATKFAQKFGVSPRTYRLVGSDGH